MENLKKEAKDACANATCGAKLKLAETYTLKDWLFSLIYTLAALAALTWLFNRFLKL